MIPAAALGLILSAAQAHWLTVAYNEGSKYGLPKYTQAIILVESSACIHRRGDDNTSLGCGQLKLSTARKVCGCKVTASTLEYSNRINLRLAARFVSQCFVRFWPDIDRATLCYNIGIPAASKASANQVQRSRYVRKVKAFLRQLQQIPVDTK